MVWSVKSGSISPPPRIASSSVSGSSALGSSPTKSSTSVGRTVSTSSWLSMRRPGATSAVISTAA
jgi:hypothetical protein